MAEKLEKHFDTDLYGSPRCLTIGPEDENKEETIRVPVTVSPELILALGFSPLCIEDTILDPLMGEIYPRGGLPW